MRGVTKDGVRVLTNKVRGNKLNAISIKAIVNKLRMPSKTVRYQLSNMYNSGLITATKTDMRGRCFSLTNKGTDELRLYEFYLNSLN